MNLNNFLEKRLQRIASMVVATMRKELKKAKRDIIKGLVENVKEK